MSLRDLLSVKTASFTIASASFVSSLPRRSIDAVLEDPAAVRRSITRRQKIEELIRTEESYVGDLKALYGFYSIIMSDMPPRFAVFSAKHDLSYLLQTHDELLGDLYRVVPFAEYDQHAQRLPTRASKHSRWHSTDGTATVTPRRNTLSTIREGRRSLNMSRSSETEPVTRCAPQVIAAVASTFLQYIPRLQKAYSQFGSHFELYRHDIEDMQLRTNAWPVYDRAIEALSGTLDPTRSQERNKKKALTVKDLLIKPIQRLPRYELLFTDLCKLTPICDDLEAHERIQSLLIELNGTCHSMDEAKDSAPTQATTWLIGSRLKWSDQLPRDVFLRLLGDVSLCGCLHIAYKSRPGIKGAYMICVLFNTTLMLAAADEETDNYTVQIGIALATATVQECDNGRGMQCHTAPHSWKVVFEQADQMYEIIFTACSAREAEVWREAIAAQIDTQTAAVTQGTSNVFYLQSPLIADMRTVGTARGKPGSFVRRMSVHRTATVGPTTDMNQVIIKNTQAYKETSSDGSSSSHLQIPRSQSLATPSHVPTLAPRRSDRARLEALLSDVWTKDALPYPGMSLGRSEQLRGSANHVIRKFSMATLTSNFSSKRTVSSESFGHLRNGTMGKEQLPPNIAMKGMKAKHATMKPAPPPTRLPLSDLLPADFELMDQAQTKRGKRGALRAFTMTAAERSFSPLLQERAQSSMKRAQSVRRAEPKEREVSEPLLAPAVEQAVTEGGAEKERGGKGRKKLMRLLGR